MVYFTGTVKLVVCEASDLRPTDFSTRLQVRNYLFVIIIVWMEAGTLLDATKCTKLVFGPQWGSSHSSLRPSSQLQREAPPSQSPPVSAVVQWHGP